MFFTLILENSSGDRIDMTTTANQYMTSKISGLHSPPGTVSTSSYAGMDGSYLNNAFIEKRNDALLNTDHIGRHADAFFLVRNQRVEQVFGNCRVFLCCFLGLSCEEYGVVH